MLIPLRNGCTFTIIFIALEHVTIYQTPGDEWVEPGNVAILKSWLERGWREGDGMENPEISSTTSSSVTDRIKEEGSTAGTKPTNRSSFAIVINPVQVI